MKISLNKKKCMFPFVQSHQDDSSHHSLVADCLPLLHPPQMPCLFSSLQLQAKSYLTLRTQFFPGKSSMSAQGCSGAPSNMFPLDLCFLGNSILQDDMFLLIYLYDVTTRQETFTKDPVFEWVQQPIYSFSQQPLKMNGGCPISGQGNRTG